MAHPFARPLHEIDTDLLSTRALKLDAQAQLAEVRRRIVELEHQELTLITTIEAKTRRFDRLLDERRTATS